MELRASITSGSALPRAAERGAGHRGRHSSVRVVLELVGLTIVVGLVLLVLGAHLRAVSTGEKQYERPGSDAPSQR
jgi:hypothetical protein